MTKGIIALLAFGALSFSSPADAIFCRLTHSLMGWMSFGSSVKENFLPPEAKDGPMEARLADLQREFSDRVAVLPVMVSAPPGRGESSSPAHAKGQEVVVISTKGMDQESLASLDRAYQNAVSRDSLSFIFSPKRIHMFSRLGNKLIDYQPIPGNLSVLRAREYGVAPESKVEVMITLSPQEFDNTITYVRNVQRDVLKVLGDAPQLDVAKGGMDLEVLTNAVERRLEQNRFLESCNHHNCLTWLTTAPIGAGNAQLIELLGATSQQIESEVHSYTVAFAQYLMTRPKDGRTRIVFFTNKPLEEATAGLTNDPTYLHRHFFKPD